jgi:protein arginine kinase
MSLPHDGVRELVALRADWLTGRGPHADVVISSRVRLARNLEGMAFPQAADEPARSEVLAAVKSAAMQNNYFQGAAFFACQDLSPLGKQALVERRMASRDLVGMGAGSGVLVGSEQSLSLMINEEDHLRLQGMFSGLDLLEAFRVADQIDDMLQERLDFAFSEEWGFLTACPTNVGTGLRASMLLHLPGLVLTGRIDEVLNAMDQVGMTVRGIYGENSEVLGHLFQVSNRTSLGSTELEIIESVERAGRHLLDEEGRARETLRERAGRETEDKVWRALGIMQNARVMTSEEFLNLSSAVRMGLSLEAIDKPDLATLNELLVMTQPAHLQLYCDQAMEARERDVRRAELVRQRTKERMT